MEGVATNARSMESKRGPIVSTQYHNEPLIALRAQQELQRLGKQKRLGHGHKALVRYYAERGLDQIEHRHVLIDYSDGNKQLKALMMTRREAFERNQIIAGTGFAWAVCSK